MQPYLVNLLKAHSIIALLMGTQEKKNQTQTQSVI